MATEKQVQAAKRNVKKAQQGASQKRTSRTFLQARVARWVSRVLADAGAEERQGARSRTATASNSTSSRKRRTSPAARRWESRI